MSMIKTINLTAFSLVLAAAFTQVRFGHNNYSPSISYTNQHRYSKANPTVRASEPDKSLKIFYSDVIIIGPNGKQYNFWKKE